MHQVYFSIRFRRFTQLFFFTLCVFFAVIMGASASDNCPSADDHSLSAVRYQLFAAYQTGYGGYEAPCELKCFGKQPCLSQCQQKKGLELLSKELTKLEKKNNVESCTSYTQVCMEQCKQHGQACRKACNAQDSVALTE